MAVYTTEQCLRFFLWILYCSKIVTGAYNIDLYYGKRDLGICAKPPLNVSFSLRA